MLKFTEMHVNIIIIQLNNSTSELAIVIQITCSTHPAYANIPSLQSSLDGQHHLHQHSATDVKLVMFLTYNTYNMIKEQGSEKLFG